MSAVLKSTRRMLRLSGIDLKACSRNARSLPYFWKSWAKLKSQAEASSERFEIGNLYPILEDRFAKAGTATGHYFHQDLFVARKVFQKSPRRHVDIGSRVDGFVAHVASFREIDVIDVRPLESNVPGIRFLCADMMQELPEEMHGSTDSLSCLHAIEHFGLGRYGDPIDYEGHLRGIDNLALMLEPGGTLYFSTPIGYRQRIEFNAHRVFNVPYLWDKLKDRFELVELSFIDDDGQVHVGVDLGCDAAQRSFDLHYGCGIFELKRRED